MTSISTNVQDLIIVRGGQDALPAESIFSGVTPNRENVFMVPPADASRGKTL
jgi:hypothetical protein